MGGVPRRRAPAWKKHDTGLRPARAAAAQRGARGAGHDLLRGRELLSAGGLAEAADEGEHRRAQPRRRSPGLDGGRPRRAHERRRRHPEARLRGARRRVRPDRSWPTGSSRCSASTRTGRRSPAARARFFEAYDRASQKKGSGLVPLGKAIRERLAAAAAPAADAAEGLKIGLLPRARKARRSRGRPLPADLLRVLGPAHRHRVARLGLEALGGARPRHSRVLRLEVRRDGARGRG